MTASHPDRRAALLDLVELRIDLGDAIAALRQFEWDSEAEVVVLTREHARRLLERHQHGDVDDSAVEQWANAVEGRDDIGFEPEHAELLQRFIFDAANPALMPRGEAGWAQWLPRLS